MSGEGSTPGAQARPGGLSESDFSALVRAISGQLQPTVTRPIEGEPEGAAAASQGKAPVEPLLPEEGNGQPVDDDFD